MGPVPIRPHLPVPLPTAPQAEFATYAVNNAIAQQVWDTLHPIDRTINHRPTDTALKNNVMLALATSVFPPYSILVQRYRQTDHANKTWVDLRQDIELIVTNNPTGTSRGPAFRHRDRAPCEWRQSPSPYLNPQTAAPLGSSMTHTTPPRLPAPAVTQSALMTPHTTRHRTSARRHQRPPRHEEPLPMLQLRRRPPRPGMRQPQVFICQTVFPNPAAHQAHYLSIHKRDAKRARFGQDPPRGHYTPPTSPFLSRSVQDMNNPSPYYSGYDSTYSNASGPGQPPSSRGNSDMDEQVDRYLHDQRVATLIVEGMPPINPSPTTPAAQARLRKAAQHHRRIATSIQPISHHPNQPSSTADSVVRPAVREPHRPLQIHHLGHTHVRPTATLTGLTIRTSSQRRRRRIQQILINAIPHRGLQRRRRPPQSRPSDDARNAVNHRYAQMQNQIPAVPHRQLTYDIS